MISVLDVLLVSSPLKQVVPPTISALENVLLANSLLKQVALTTTSAKEDAPLVSIQQRLGSDLMISAKNVMMTSTLPNQEAQIVQVAHPDGIQ